MTARLVLAPSLALLVLLLAAVAAPAAFADTFVVNATDDTTGTCTGTHCTLRAALTAANSLPGPDVIHFNLPVTKSLQCIVRFVCTTVFSTTPIQLATQLPDITDRVTIDGRTQPQFSGSPLVEIRRAGPNSNIDGLTLAINSDKSVIRSLAVTSFRFGIVVASNTNLIAGSRVGVDMSGVGRGNADGVVIEGDNNQVGGSSTNGDGNVISANTGDGVVICFTCGQQTTTSGSTASGNMIVGNLIGTTPSGTAAMGNNNGVTVVGLGFNTQVGAYLGGVNGNVIGGGGVFNDFHNVISGNRANGVLVEETGGTLVGGNFIGLNAAGNAAVPNATAGVALSDAPDTIVGDFGIVSQPCILGGRPASCPLDEGGPNIISGNTGDGIGVSNTINTHDVAVLGNKIGTDVGGALAIGNGANGIKLSGVASRKNNRIGANTVDDSNLISFNRDAGVRVVVAPSAGFGTPTIRFNSILSNTGLGIDEGTSASDSGAPSITSVTSNSTSTTVAGQINRGPFAGTASTAVDFYVNQGCDPSGSGEGASYITSSPVLISTSPLDTGFSVTFATPVQIGSVLTATQNGTAGGTSMFSQCQTVVSDGSTGTFVLSPRIATVSTDQTLSSQLTWTVPAPRVWRNLATIDVLLVDEHGHPAMQIHWDEAANTFGLAGHGAAFTPGTHVRLENEWASIDLADATVVGSGPTGPSVTLTLPVRFKERAHGHTFDVEVAASDDLGHHDGFLSTGEWLVAPRH